MKIDCHVHTRMGDGYAIPGKYDAKEFASQLSLAGLDGAAIYSPSPKGYKNRSWQERLQLGLDVCKSGENLYPFYWINPTDEDAKEQVDAAILGGYVAFKIIAFDFSVKEKKVLDVISYIAECGKAIMFHSGICWDGMNSCDNLRPSNFEALIDIPNLRFCLAHVSWPWYDECIALYGKLNWHKRTHPTAPEMFIDITPGTPPVYRDDVFRHLLLSYNFRNNLMFGSDCNTDGYDAKMSAFWQETDNALYEKYVATDVEDFKDHIYGMNFFRFIGEEYK